jgi:CubicO group peptidase (beta-lactamase class C family)
MNTSFREVCAAAAAEWSVPSLAVGTAVDGDVSVVALGCEPDARFRAASITKPFTALLALGLLDPDDVTGVWPDDVRVRHLLSHLSGFDCELTSPDLARFGAGDDALAAAVAELPAVRRFVGVDEIWSYANTGYWLLGLLAAFRAGVTFEEALAARVLEPFGLGATSFDEPDLAGTGVGATSDPYPRARRPSGGLVSNAADLVRFGLRLLDEPLFAEMHRPYGKPLGGVYGYGLFGERVGGIEVWGHTGSFGGFQSQLLLVPSVHAVFAGLTNSGIGAKALYEVEQAFFGEVIDARRVLQPFVELPPAQLARYEGRYANGDADAEIRVESGGLVLAVAGEELFLRPIGGERFRVPDGPHVRERIDFPRPGFVRLGSRLAERVA